MLGHYQLSAQLRLLQRFVAVLLQGGCMQGFKMQPGLNESGTSRYLEISPNFGIKEHYLPPAHGSLNLFVSNLCPNTISVM